MSILRIIIWGLLIIFCYFIYEQFNQEDIKSSSIIEKKIDVFDLSLESQTGLMYLNRLREGAGLDFLSQSEVLKKSAVNHANYLVLNNRVGHDEIIGENGFTGINVKDRSEFVGYNAFYISENVSTGSKNVKESIDSLFAGIYHRFGFLDFKISEIGIGIAQDTNNTNKTSFVYNMGNGRINALCNKKSFNGHGKYVYGVCLDKTFKIEEKAFKAARQRNEFNTKIVIYPYVNQKDVPPVFFNETPDPLPEYEVSGFPISISFDERVYKEVELISFKLFDDANNLVEDTLIYDHLNDPNGEFKKFEFALFPLKRLRWNSKYSVEVIYMVDGKQEETKWSFFTRELEEPVIVVKKDEYEVNKNRSTIFYFEPDSKLDVSHRVSYPSSVIVELIDLNTIRLITNENTSKNIKIKFGKHELHVKVKNR